MELTKSQIKKELNKRNIAYDENLTKSDLESLLKSILDVEASNKKKEETEPTKPLAGVNPSLGKDDDPDLDNEEEEEVEVSAFGRQATPQECFLQSIGKKPFKK